MATESSYYVPEQSKLPLLASIGLFLFVFGLGSWLNGQENGPFITLFGFVWFGAVLWSWFSAVIKENLAGLNSAQLKRSYVWAMGWFIFSEVMFFAAFFGALFYIRSFALPWLAGEGGHSEFTGSILWPGFEANWPLYDTPAEAVSGADASVQGPDKIIDPWSLPLVNTIILLASSVTIHFAHSALKAAKRKAFNIWLGVTIVLGLAFVALQIEEYFLAYNELGLTLASGIYGTTFFLLTGFHGLHVTLGAFMLIVMFLRSVMYGHFKPDDSFGFDAASWYWHFVDVVWVGLFIFVYVLGS